MATVEPASSLFFSLGYSWLRVVPAASSACVSTRCTNCFFLTWFLNEGDDYTSWHASPVQRSADLFWGELAAGARGGGGGNRAAAQLESGTSKTSQNTAVVEPTTENRARARAVGGEEGEKIDATRKGSTSHVRNTKLATRNRKGCKSAERHSFIV